MAAKTPSSAERPAPAAQSTTPLNAWGQYPSLMGQPPVMTGQVQPPPMRNDTSFGQQYDPIAALFQALMGPGTPEMTPPMPTQGQPPMPTQAPGLPAAPAKPGILEMINKLLMGG